MKITDILDRLDSVSAMAVVVVIMIVFFILGWFISRRKDISDLWNSWYQNRKKKDELLNIIVEDHEKMKEYARSISEINTKLDKLDNLYRQTERRLEENEEKNNKRVRAELKDKIRMAYQVYHNRGYWNDMEKESLEDLIAEYESHKGKNSFVHSVVEKEMYTWEIRPLE